MGSRNWNCWFFQLDIFWRMDLGVLLLDSNCTTPFPNGFNYLGSFFPISGQQLRLLKETRTDV
ncbi:hypothetical protein C1H46_030166 [Malus baccata]|uniref:Uncharacterized protein n=1 Tax=Malus baccata TaxID=106549 RepID=A0A540LCT0_MALBA|nr:hypothetical protein C1H46_030166 [Malus baccata]